MIHGKAPGTPDTYNGSPIWVPARGFRTVDMRYWSLCNNDLALPISVVNCAADLTTSLQGGDYTIVISDDLLRPDWLRPNINWLPWGDKQYPKLIMFRNMLSCDRTFPSRSKRRLTLLVARLISRCRISRRAETTYNSGPMCPASDG